MRFTRREVISGGSKGDLFVKIADGESLTGVFRGEVYEFCSKWEGGKSYVVDKSDPDGKLRFRLNFVSKDAGQWVAKIFEFGITVYNQLADINEDADLTSTVVKITRRGTGTDTVWTVMPSLKQALSKEDWSAIKSVSLKALEHKERPTMAAQFSRAMDAFDPSADEADTPF